MGGSENGNFPLLYEVKKALRMMGGSIYKRDIDMVPSSLVHNGTKTCVKLAF